MKSIEIIGLQNLTQHGLVYTSYITRPESVETQQFILVICGKKD